MGGLEGLLKGGWVVLFAGLGMLGVEEVVEVAFAVGGIARSHEGFGGRGDRVAVEIPLAAISVVLLGAAGARGV